MTIPNCQEFRAWHIIDIHKPPWYVLERNFQHVSLAGWDANPPPPKAPDARRGGPPTWMTGGRIPKIYATSLRRCGWGFWFSRWEMISLEDLETIQDNGCLSPSNSKIVDDVEIEISHKIWRFKLPLCISWCFNYLVFEFPCGDLYTIWHEQQVTSPSGQFVLACLTHPQVRKIKRWKPFILNDTVWVLQYSWQNWFLASLGCFKWHLFFDFHPETCGKFPSWLIRFFFQMGWNRHLVVQFSCI